MPIEGGKADHVVARARARFAFKKLAPYLKRGERILNLGSGDGYLSKMIREAFGSEVVNVDIDDRILLPDDSVVVYDGEHLPFPDGDFDGILLLHVLHHCLDQEQVAREAARVCRGRVLVIEDRNRSRGDLFWLRMIHAYLEKVEDMPLADCMFRSPQGWVEMFRGVGLKATAQTTWPLYMNFLPPGNVMFELRPMRKGKKETGELDL